MRVTVDIIIYAIREGVLRVLLVKRKIDPFKGSWAIPGGFVAEGESIEEAAKRELKEETGVSDVYLEQLYTFGEPKRDPRGRLISIAYFAILPSERPILAGTDADIAQWFDADNVPPLAFDHKKILAYARERLSNKLEYTTVGFKLLPEKFTLSELQHVYEAVLGKELDKRNFRRKVKLLDVLEPLKEQKKEITRPAQLFRFSEHRFRKLTDKGILFPF